MGVAGISHVTLSSRDVETTVRFYVDVLGFELVARWPAGAYLVGGGVARIHSSGASFWQDNWTEGDSRYFTDPDGHRLEIHATTLSQRIESALAQPWDELNVSERALDVARPASSVADPYKPRRLACVPVGVFVAVIDDGDRILMLDDPTSRRLEVPNGAVEPGEQPSDAARRELAEEAGRLEVGPMRCGAAFNVDFHPHLPPLLSLGFVCSYISGEPVAGDDMAGCAVQ